MRKIIEINEGMARMPEWRLKNAVNFSLMEGEHIAIIGDNGSGKTKLVDMITGRHPVFPDQCAYDFGSDASRLASENMRHITFRDSYGSYDGSYYLQQRWNQQEIDEEMPTVGNLLEEAYRIAGDDTEERRVFQKHLYEMFELSSLIDKKIILLSSGEMRKFQLTKVLLARPRVLIMDNPFIGLDSLARLQLSDLLALLAGEGNIQIVLVLTKPADIPAFITHVWEMRDETTLSKYSRKQYLAMPRPAEVCLSEEKRRAILSLRQNPDEYDADKVVELHNVAIRYGERTILKNLDWLVKSGDRWALCGRNGSGKSTLLSLLCADNPQAYACDITLFDHRRGTGETIWEIKHHIGYVSPEMHRAYMKDIPAIDIVASGLHDSVGLYVRPKAEDYEACRFWMRIFGIENLENRTFLKLSSGEQRLVLLARAFVKDPQLLILDEPLHGLDPNNAQLAIDIIDTFCQRRAKTLIMVSHYREELPQCITAELELKLNRN